MFKKPPGRQSTMSVLVVDDDVALCRIIHRMLSDEHYTVQTAQSVADAFRAIARRCFDVYVLDYKLTDGTGFDVAKCIWSKSREIPLILMSGYDRSFFALSAERLRISVF